MQDEMESDAETLQGLNKGCVCIMVSEEMSEGLPLASQPKHSTDRSRAHDSKLSFNDLLTITNVHFASIGL